MENHEHHRSTDGQDKYPLMVCGLTFVEKKTVTRFIIAASLAFLGVVGTVLLQCNSDARENGVRDTKIYNVEKTQIEILNTVNKVSDATSTRQTEILKAIDDLKRINRTR